MTATRFTLRAATVADADAVAALCRRTRQIALPYLPDLHTYADDCVYFRDVVFAGDEVHLAERDGNLLGAIAFGNGWVSQLDVDPAEHGRGIGGALLRLAMDAQPTSSSDVPAGLRRAALLRAARLHARAHDGRRQRGARARRAAGLDPRPGGYR